MCEAPPVAVTRVQTSKTVFFNHRRSRPLGASNVTGRPTTTVPHEHVIGNVSLDLAETRQSSGQEFERSNGRTNERSSGRAGRRRRSACKQNQSRLRQGFSSRRHLPFDVH